MIIDHAIAAGWIDGEGCITIGRRKPKGSVNWSYTLCVIVANTDHRIMDWFTARWGGSIQETTGQSRTQLHMCYRWQIGASKAAQLLRDVRPYLIIKGEQADLALRFQTHVDARDTSWDSFAEREEMWIAMKRAKHTFKVPDL